VSTLTPFTDGGKFNNYIRNHSLAIVFLYIAHMILARQRIAEFNGNSKSHVEYPSLASVQMNLTLSNFHIVTVTVT